MKMRHRFFALFLTFVIIFSVFSGCQGNGTEGEKQLLLYKRPSDLDVDAAIRIFEEQYPDVEVIVEEYDTDSYGEKLSTALMSGGGPDVVFLGKSTFPDVYKVMEQGTFLDLTSMTEDGELLAPENVNEAVMKAGQYGGKQYIIPYQYTVTTVLTTANLLQEYGLEELTETTDFTEFWTLLLDAFPQMQEKNPDAYAVIGDFPLWMVLSNSGVMLLDREVKEVLPDEEGLRQLTEIYKRGYESGAFGETERYFRYDEIPNAMEADEILIYADANVSLGSYIGSLCYVKTLGETETFLMPTLSGGYYGEVLNAIGINSATKNPENARRFLEIYLSEEVYTSVLGNGSGLNVQKHIMDNMLKEDFWTQHVEYVSERTGVPMELTREEVEEHVAKVTDIGICGFYEEELWEMYQECMQPYVEGRDSYEACLEALRDMLTIYLTE